jgi:uncharacterized protein YqcC (DUF446 family)
MMEKIIQVADSLLIVEAEMRRISVWSAEQPSEGALQSRQPFSIDTLEFTEWLQFIFLPRMRSLVEQNRPLPSISGIAPMAEEHFRGDARRARYLIRELEKLDRLLTDSSAPSD